jgi:hypothetical protein
MENKNGVGENRRKKKIIDVGMKAAEDKVEKRKYWPVSPVRKLYL